MVSAIVGEVTGQLEKRFLLNAFFPTLAFVLALGLAVAAGAKGVPAGIETWEGQGSVVQVLLAIGAVGLVFLLANVLSNGMLQVIGLFEGYRGPARWAGSWGSNRHLSRAADLLAKANEGDLKAADEFQRAFPVHPRTLTADAVAPTRLGNVLRSAETYPMDRYGADSVRLWPRLYHLLPDTMVASLAEARASMEFLLAIAFLAAVYAPLASIYLIVASGPLAWALATLLVGSTISIAAYFAALAPASIYGDHVRSAFDLHRLELLRTAGVPVPATPAEEVRSWAVFTQFLERGQVYESWRYVFNK